MVAFGGFPAGDTPWVFLWFGMLMAGVMFIAMALKDENRHKEQDDSVRDLQELRDLPLRAVREALRPPRPPKQSPDPSRPRSAPAPRPRTYGARTGGPRGLVK